MNTLKTQTPPDPLWKEFNETQEQAGDVAGDTVTDDDLDETFEGCTYLFRLNLADSDGNLASSANTIDELKRKYGAENIIASMISIDPDNQEKVTRSDGTVGVCVKSEAKAAVDSA